MKRTISRNIAIITAIFIITLSVMLITNYFQIRDTTPLQLEVIETLKQLNDSNANNPVLQEQIRQLDLMARRAYFIRYDHLIHGIYLLIGSVIIFIICIQVYFSGYKNIPDKNLDPIDEWAIKTKARRSITISIATLAAAALVFAFLSSPFLKEDLRSTENETEALLVNAEPVSSDPVQYVAEEPVIVEELTEAAESTTEPVAEAADLVPEEEKEPIAQPQVRNNTPHYGFRGNHSNGISNARNIPVKWDLTSGQHISWKQPILRKGFNSPVISGNQVFITGADDQARELFCYDLNTGELKWTLDATNIPGSPQQMPKTTDDTGLAASTVAANGNQVCAIFASGDVICADMNGNRLWAKNIGVPDNHYGYASSLLIYGNSLIIQYDNQNNPRVLSLDLATGNEKWSKNRQEKATWSSPIIATVNNTPQLILMGNPAITAYNPSNGEQLWRVECLTGEVSSSACDANNIVFGASEYAKLVAINANNGQILWESNEYLPEVSSPVATDNNLYVATSYGVLASYDPKSGEIKKEHDLGTEFYSSPMIVEDKIFLFSNDGKMHIFSADDEFNLIDSFNTGERTLTTPAFTDGKIVVRTEKNIYCVNAN